MTENEEIELLSLIRDNNKMLRDIWTLLKEGSPNDDLKDLVMNVVANLLANKIEKQNDRIEYSSKGQEYRNYNSNSSINSKMG